MVALKNFILFAATATALVIKRDAHTIANDLVSINSNVTALHTAINNYSGGVLSAIPIQTASNNLETAIKSATTDATNSSVVSDADAKSIIAYINGTVEPNIAGTVNALIAKKAQVQTDGLTSLVKTAFGNLKNDTDSFGAALLAKASSNQTANGQAALTKIDGDLDGGITTFS